MAKNNLATALDKFSRTKIAIIGDLILDRFLFGDVHRLSPEAPVPILSISQEVIVPGGAGNVGANISSLGGKAFIISVVGTDDVSTQLVSLLTAQNIDPQYIIKDDIFILPEKTRVIGQEQHIVRIDKEDIKPMDQNTETKVMQCIKENIDAWDLMVISDYAKGFVTPKLAKFIIQISKKHGKRVIVDTKPENIKYFRGAYLITPNLKEAYDMSGTKDINQAGKILQKMTQAKVLITQGANGMTLFDGNRRKHVSAKEHKVFDVVGAGDTVMATLALSLAAKISLDNAVDIANHAAGIVVTKRGTATVTAKELKEELSRV